MVDENRDGLVEVDSKIGTCRRLAQELTSASRHAEEVATRRWLVTALGTLTARERAVVVLRHYFDLPEAQVARELDVSVGTVKSTASRGLARLRELIPSTVDSLGGSK